VLGSNQRGLSRRFYRPRAFARVTRRLPAHMRREAPPPSAMRPCPAGLGAHGRERAWQRTAQQERLPPPATPLLASPDPRLQWAEPRHDSTSHSGQAPSKAAEPLTKSHRPARTIRTIFAVLPPTARSAAPLQSGGDRRGSNDGSCGDRGCPECGVLFQALSCDRDSSCSRFAAVSRRRGGRCSPSARTRTRDRGQKPMPRTWTAACRCKVPPGRV
jgi:hypothetical protein